MSAIGRLRISPSDIGRRVTVRHLAGDDLTDVLGHLVSWIESSFFRTPITPVGQSPTQETK